jgi:hypothetical protein
LFLRRKAGIPDRKIDNRHDVVVTLRRDDILTVRDEFVGRRTMQNRARRLLTERLASSAATTSGLVRGSILRISA